MSPSSNQPLIFQPPTPVNSATFARSPGVIDAEIVPLSKNPGVATINITPTPAGSSAIDLYKSPTSNLPQSPTATAPTNVGRTGGRIAGGFFPKIVPPGVGGVVARRIVPGIGWLLLAYDAYQMGCQTGILGSRICPNEGTGLPISINPVFKGGQCNSHYQFLMPGQAIYDGYMFSGGTRIGIDGPVKSMRYLYTNGSYDGVPLHHWEICNNANFCRIWYGASKNSATVPVPVRVDNNANPIADTCGDPNSQPGGRSEAPVITNITNITNNTNNYNIRIFSPRFILPPKPAPIKPPIIIAPPDPFPIPFDKPEIDSKPKINSDPLPNLNPKPTPQPNFPAEPTSEPPTLPVPAPTSEPPALPEPPARPRDFEFEQCNPCQAWIIRSVYEIQQTQSEHTTVLNNIQNIINTELRSDNSLREILGKVNSIVSLSNNIQAQVNLALDVVNNLNQSLFAIEADIINTTSLIAELQLSITLQFEYLSARVNINAVLTTLANIQLSISNQTSIINEIKSEINSLTLQINSIINSSNNNQNSNIDLIFDRLEQIKLRIVTVVNNRIDVQANFTVTTITTHLAEIVRTINNKIDAQINTVISSILVGIGGIINIQPVLNAIANLKLELSPKFSYTENNIINRLNTSFNFSSVLNVLAQIEFNINAKLNDCIENEYEFDLEQTLINLRAEVTNISTVVNAIRVSNVQVDFSSLTNAINQVELSLTNTINTSSNTSSLQYTLNQLQTLINSNSTITNSNLSALILANQNNSQLIANVNTAIVAVRELLNVDIAGDLIGFNCETGEDVNYAYTGSGLLGLKAELIALSQQLKQTTIDVCPEITGQIEYDHDCDEETENKIIPYTGRGLIGIKNLMLGISETIIDANKNICEINSEANCHILFPGEQFSEFNVPTQLNLTFGEQYPGMGGSLWHMNIPHPINWQELDWCTHFEPMVRTLGHHQGRVYFEGNKMWVGGYAESEESIIEFLTKYIVPLTKLPVEKRKDGTPRIRTTSGGNVKRLPDKRKIKCVKAVYAEIAPDTHEILDIRCFTPPVRGC